MPDSKHTTLTCLMVILLLALLTVPACAGSVQLNGTSSIGVDQTLELKDTAALSANRHFLINVANDAGVKYDKDGALYGGPDNTYYMKFDGGGVNALHISGDPSNSYGSILTSASQSGVFYLTDTGGRGFDDDGILMLAVQGDVPDDFRVHIRASGYTWTPSPVANLKPTAYTHVDGTVDETFTKNDLIYGPQIWKPCSMSNYPIYCGQDMSDTQNTFQMMFIDLKAGLIDSNTTAGAPPLQDNGAIRVEYSFENLNTFAAFDAYAWCLNSNQGQGITWTNAVNALGQSATSSSGYTVTGTPRPAPAAGFTANPTTGTAPLAVRFTDTSTGSPTSWSWSFGDGTTSMVQNPVHTYTTAGTYTVALTATNAGGSTTATQTRVITVQTPASPTTVATTAPTTVSTTVPTTTAQTTVPTTVPTTTTVAPTPTATQQPVVANFSANVTAGQTPLAVQFSDSTTGTVQNYFWQFGDGGASYDRNPVHVYTTAGRYTVSLIASGSNGAQVKTIEQYINVTEPAPTPTTPTVTQLPDYHYLYLKVANDEGARFDLHNNGTYYQKNEGGGLNALWMTGDPAVPKGQTITTSNQSGVFYLTDTGGRGWDDDGVLMLAVNGTIPDTFRVHIRASGYTWSPVTEFVKLSSGTVTYVDGSIDETFTKADFIYGPQIWKPAGQANYPIYNGQNMSDTQNTFYLMFIDLNAGIIGKNGVNTTSGTPTLQNRGAIKVEYSFENLNTFAAFDAYGWCKYTSRGEGISWTNAVNALGQSSLASGFSVVGMPASTAPVSIPSATSPPTDPNRDGLYEDLNGNGMLDFNDVVLYFNQMDWIAEHEQVSAFDFNKNGSIDFNDIVILFNSV